MSELPKAVVETSFWKALLRCRIHLIPVLFTITILVLTFRNFYIGTEFQSLIESETLNLLLLQVAAKIQELLIVASLTTIIFHLARTELLFGDGLPLGLIGSAFSFSNLRYFVSSEFVGSIRYKGNRWRKARFLAMLVVAGIIAALAGPSTAVLIVPRKQEIDAGGTSFFLPGTKDDLWPIELDASVVGSSPYCTSRNATKYAICPSAGFNSVWSHFDGATFANFKTATTSVHYAKPLSGTAFYWSISSPLSVFPRVLSLGNPRKDNSKEGHTFLIQPHATTAYLLEMITTKWWTTLLWKMGKIADEIDDRFAKSTTLNPITQVKCAPPKDLFNSTSVDFPVLRMPGGWISSDSYEVDTLRYEPSEHLRFRWVHLPNSFGPVTIGAVFESAWTSDNSSRVAIGCSIQSQWFNGTLYSNEYNFWSGWYAWDTRFDLPRPAWVPPEAGGTFNRTNGRIAVSDSWLDMLTPLTPEEGPGHFSWRPTTIESVLLNTGFIHPVPTPGNTSQADVWGQGDLTGEFRTSLLETIICTVFEDGLSRAGSHLLFTNSSLSSPDPSTWQLSLYNPTSIFNSSILAGSDSFLPPSDTKAPFNTLKVQFVISGYAFSGSLAGYLAMSVLLAHLLLALGHTIWSLKTKKTSNSWDSISKLVALSQNSRSDPRVLINTSAGIEKYSTYSQTARIKATDGLNDEGF